MAFLQNYIFCETFIQTFSKSNTFDIPAMQNKNLKYVVGECICYVIICYVMYDGMMIVIVCNKTVPSTREGPVDNIA